MKSNCCQAKVEVCGDANKYYLCMKCVFPCDPWQCIRCNKLLDGTNHTCTPTKQYRGGIVEGMKECLEMIRDKAQNESFSRHHFGQELIANIEKLIKQYEGDDNA